MTFRQRIPATALVVLLLMPGIVLAGEEAETPHPVEKEDCEIVALLELLEFMEMFKDMEVLAAFEEDKNEP
jgi:hypothetical protein